MSFEQPPIQLGGGPERGLAKPTNHICHVDYALGRRYIQHPNQPRNRHAEALRNLPTVALVDHKEIGIRVLREPNRFSFAAIESTEYGLCYGAKYVPPLKTGFFQEKEHRRHSELDSEPIPPHG